MSPNRCVHELRNLVAVSRYFYRLQFDELVVPASCTKENEPECSRRREESKNITIYLRFSSPFFFLPPNCQTSPAKISLLAYNNTGVDGAEMEENLN